MWGSLWRMAAEVEGATGAAGAKALMGEHVWHVCGVARWQVAMSGVGRGESGT